MVDVEVETNVLTVTVIILGVIMVCLGIYAMIYHLQDGEKRYYGSSEDATYGLNSSESSIIRSCYGTVWNWDDVNETNCKCTNRIENYSYCNTFIEYKYCTNDLEGLLESEMFATEIYPYLNYDCETGELLDTQSSGSTHSEVDNG